MIAFADGRRTFDDAMRLQAPWINALADGLALTDVQTFQRMVIAVRQKHGEQ